MTQLMKNRAAKDGAKINVDPKMVQEGSYVIGNWETTDGHAGGQALAKINGAKLQLLEMAGGSMDDLAWLEQQGVPPADAKALVNDMKNAGW